MSPVDYMKLSLSRYADFSGRSRRMELGMFIVMNIGASIVASILDGILGMSGMLFGLYGLFQAAVALGLFIPGLAVGVRRMHDQDKSGWWLLIAFIPIIGWIVLLVFYLTDGTRGTNQYGPDPKANG